VPVPAATTANHPTPVLAVGTYNYTVRVTEGSGFYVLSNVAVVIVRNPVVTVGPLTNGTLDPASRMVIYNTGSGLKYLEAYSALFPR